MSFAPHDPIAIVGMSGRFAGASDLHAYWRMIVEGRDGFGPVPPDRWAHAAFFDPSPRQKDKSYTPTGGFIEDVRSFPAIALGLPPRRVEVMDPQQRLALEVSLEAVDDAGVRPADLPRRTGVFLGVTAVEYRTLQAGRILAQLMNTGALGEAPADPEALAAAVRDLVPPRAFTAPGLLSNMVAATVAQELHLHGPAFTSDAACASSLVSIAEAVAGLRSGRLDAALAGGVYLCLTPEHHIAFSRIGAISASGVCRPFDARADGFVQGDGCGVLVLKRLADARRDGDRVYATLRGVAMNNDGGGEGPMAPVQSGQVECVRDAWADAGLAPEALGYLEAHGTGTQVGDRTELAGLVEALPGVAGAALGSAKANIGHTMSAAGVAGVMRAALAIHHRTLPPLAHFESAKPELDLDASGFRVPTAPEAWTAETRVAAVSSFGFGGTNVHAVLAGAEHDDFAARAAGQAAEQRADQPATQAEPQLELVLLSAPDEDTLRDLARRTADAVEADPSVTVAGVAHAWRHRTKQPARLGVVAATREALVAALREPRFVGTATERPRVAFMFPGQGAQRTGMLADLRRRFPVVEATLRAADAALDVDLFDLLYPEVDDDAASARLTDTQHCQPALLAVGAALTRLLADAGVRPDVVCGHSVGEFTAAVAAGVLDLEDGARWVRARGRAMAEMSGDTGAMLALFADAETAAELCIPGAVVANVNHPRQTVVAGSTEAVAVVAERAQAAKVRATTLKVSHGFHSPVFADLDLDAVVDGLDLRDPEVPLVSCIDDGHYADAAQARRVFKAHATSAVQWTRALQNIEAEVYLQVGAGGPLVSFAKGALGRGGGKYLSLASTDDHDGGRSLLETLARLWTLGVDVDPNAFTTPAPVASVPPRVLPREVYWAVKSGGQAPALSDARAQTLSTPDASSVSAPAAPTDDVRGRVLDVIARVSAYPISALRDEMRLSNDLGFDSMMLTELSTELAQAIPGVDGVPQALLLDQPTIAQIIAFAEAPTSAHVEVDDDAPLTAFVPTWRPAPAETGPSPTRPALVWVHSAPPVPVTAVLAGEAEAPDPAADFLDLVTRRAAERPDVLLVAPHDDPWAEGLAGAVRALAREWPDATIKCVRHDAASLAPSEADPDRARALADAATSSRPPPVLTVGVGTPNGSESRVGPLELLHLTVVGAEPSDPRVALALRERDDLDRAVDVAWLDGRRHVAGLRVRQPARHDVPAHQVASSGKRRPLAGSHAVVAPNRPSVDGAAAPHEGPAGEPSSAAVSHARDAQVADVESTLAAGRPNPFDAEVVLVTGGTRGIGARLADRLETLGATVLRLGRAQADVLDRDALGAWLAEQPPVTTLVHAAGVLADGALEQVEPEAGRLAREIKWRGLLNALAVTAPSLRRVCALGSWAGRFGNRHQVHYAAGNAALTGIIDALPERITGTVAEFGPWTDSEMVQSIPETARAAMRADGVDFVGDQAGLDALLDALGRDGVVVYGRRLPRGGRRLRRTERLDTATHLYLLDHALDGRPTLPLAGAAAMLADAAALAPPFEITELTLFDGVEVSEPVELTVHVEGDQAELRRGDTLCYRARIQPEATTAPAAWRTDAHDTPELSLAAFYAEHTFHGPLLQGVEAIDALGPEVIQGRIRLGDRSDWIPGDDRPWQVDPLALDSAMQLTAYVAWTRFGRAGTPMKIDRLVQHAPLPAPGTVVKAQAIFEDGDGDVFTADLALFTDDGAPLMTAAGVAARMPKVGEGEASEFDARWSDPAQWPEYLAIKARQAEVAALGVANPYFDVHQGTARDTTVIDGREVINYSSYNYLGLSGDPRIREAVTEAMEKYGTSVSASRVACGERPFHGALERGLAAAQGAEDAIVFPSGHATNVTTIGHLFGPKDLVLHDELIHDSCLQGIKLSGAARRGFRHDDPAHLEAQIGALRSHYEKVLVLIEGVYSMDGDVATLPEYVRIKERHGALLMIDEAHSFGTIGATGRGIGEFHDIDGARVDIWMGTLSKSLASMGGWIAGRRELIEYLRYTTPGFVFAAGMTPTLGQAALSALELMQAEPWRVTQLQANSRFFCERLRERGVNTGDARGESPVVPVITGDSAAALFLSDRLLKQGINAKPIIFPAVAEDAARLRFFLTALHTEAQLVRTAEAVAETLEGIRAELTSRNA